ncbi:hypothetical protein D9601_16370 [Sphingomonas sp. MA1305]|jgi:hypothetical protein|uniref:hypothetical protein n=1 Tax=Sphingomonas sp. MA1305 TaxID=2479204 RepID=UPI0018DF920D|nr:hypothetical protein [Sphingomonas sp. MA1305]MBI0476929.1 hypothetical protein [Sphingomonas sp. MA1305]
MLDIETYIQTRHLPGGPIVLMKQIPIEEPSDAPVTRGVLIGRILGLGVVIALGVYASFAI